MSFPSTSFFFFFLLFVRVLLFVVFHSRLGFWVWFFELNFKKRSSGVVLEVCKVEVEVGKAGSEREEEDVFCV